MLNQKMAPGRAAAIGLALVVTGLAGCGETTVNAPLPAARVEAVSGAGQRGPAGGPLPLPIEVRVFGTDEQPLPGAAVTFSAASGGSANPQSATTDANGVARTQWTVGQTAGTNVLTASAGGSISTTVNATVTAARAASVALVAGDNQTAAAGSAVTVAPSVRVTDSFGNLVENAAVTFSVLSGGGRVTNGVRTTNAQGIATVGSWILGPVSGPQTLAARVEEGGVNNNPIVFTATATAPTGSAVAINAGNNQSAPVGRLVPIAPSVIVRNSTGTGVPGVVVNFAVATGDGSVVGSRQITDISGIATVGGWFLGPLPGANTMTATVDGIAPVTFTATGTAAEPVAMVAISQITQSAPISSAVTDPPSVIVRDAQGIPVPGVAVTFTVSTGGGVVAGSPATTNSLGVATVTSWTLGAVVGPNTVTATATGLPSVTFTANSTAGSAAAVVAVSGDNQTAVQGTTVALPPTVRVTDATGNPVVGTTVTFVVTGGGGNATGLVGTTNALGQASVGSWTLGTGDPNSMTATVTGSGITGNPVQFTAQSATQIAITSAPASPQGLSPAQFTITAQLRNSSGAAVALAGVQLTLAIATGGGTLNGTATLVTNASGVVSFTGMSVTGAAGARTFTVSGTGLTAGTTASITFN